MIGSKVVGKATVAGQLGEISAQSDAIQIAQDVRFREVEAAATLITIEQSVGEISPARTLIRFQQQVIAAGTQPTDPENRPPAAYIYINDEDYSSRTARDTVRVTFNEGQSATASIFVFWPIGATINIPALHGKPVRIETHLDPVDPASEIVSLFTGWVETARHDRMRGGVEIQCTDLRDERLGREDAGQLKSLTGALYSNTTQKEDATGREYVTEMMKTVSGSLGYSRSGELRYYSWGVGSKPVDLTLLDADVTYEDISTEFQTRSSIVNAVTVNIDYRYSLLRSINTEVDAYKPRMYQTGWSQGPAGSVKQYDLKAFKRDYIIDQVQRFSPFETLDYSLYPLERVVPPPGSDDGILIDVLWANKESWCQGFKASLVRRVAQTVVETYTYTLTAPQSVDAYGETIDGSELQFAIDTEYDRDQWEIEIKQSTDRQYLLGGDSEPETDFGEEEQAKADNLRTELLSAFNASYAIAKKEILSSHRQNFVSAKVHRIVPIDIGQILEHDNRIVQSIGQIAGIEYTIADGIRDTEIRMAISYLDTEVTPPPENWVPPEAPTKPERVSDLESEAEYNEEESAFDIEIAEIPADLTDEFEPEMPEYNYTLPIEINDIVLVNGY